jgi:aerobic-type carbon monoxide dehydrogenase small subunit (CoxS/CutS family)
MRTVSFTLNGKPTRITTDETRLLLWVLRDDLGLTGTKFGCGEAVCGSCTAVVDNDAVRSCVTAIGDVDGKHVTTIEGLAESGALHPLQQAFAEHAAFQCGYCTPGMIMGAYAVLAKTPDAPLADVLHELEDHVCRCGAHVRILQALETASAAMKGRAR